MNKKPLIVANWKCNPSTLAEAKKLFNLVKKGIRNIKNAEVVICPPFVYLEELGIRKKELGIKLGAQDCFWEEKGPFTGEISPSMLKDLGCQYIILGHSERRKHLRETDEMVNKKVKALLAEGMRPIVCIDKISQLKGVSPKNVIIAYEPLFAIGTGRACSPEKAGKMRKLLKEFKMVLYGGSVDPQNAKDYIKVGFQGLLVGGASLNPKEFTLIIKNVNR